jgi:hypothetical protein
MRTLQDIDIVAIVQDIVMGKVHYNDLEVLPDDLKETLKGEVYSYDFMIASYNIMKPLCELVLNLATFSQVFAVIPPGPIIKEKYVRIVYKYDTQFTLICPNANSIYYNSLISTYEMRKEAEIDSMIKSWRLNKHV